MCIRDRIIEAEYKTSKSAIGFEISEYFVAVANYDDKSVDAVSYTHLTLPTSDLV